MSAQLGNTIVLSYGPQGAQQLGDVVVLSYQPVSTTRRVSASIAARWVPSDSLTVEETIPHDAVKVLDPQTVTVWGSTQDLQNADSIIWEVSAATDIDRALPWAPRGTPLQPQESSYWGVADQRDLDRSNPWGRYEKALQPQAGYFWVGSRAVDDQAVLPWGGPLVVVQPELMARFFASARGDAEKRLPWNRYSNPLNPGWGIPTPPNPNPDDLGDQPGALLYILPARFYMTAHNIYAERLSDAAEVPIFEASVSADSGSFCWTLQASGPASLFEQLAPVSGLPVQLRLMLDGLPWVFAVDSLSRNSAFGKSGVSITGRSVTALIGAPYLRQVARDNASEALTAQQLAVAALDTTGIDLDWGLTDWLVPAGAWSHQGTPLDAVQAIAQAAGGYLQSHRSAPTLLTRHAYSDRSGVYPGAPWGWSTGPADVELAPDAIITQALERRDGPDINAIYVSGTTQGVLALVKRAGSAADKLAAMATDPLITHVDAARQRGLATLGTAGAQYNVRLDLPVMVGVDQPGVLEVGQLVQINASDPWRGRVRSVSVIAKSPSLRQTITLERHL